MGQIRILLAALVAGLASACVTDISSTTSDIDTVKPGAGSDIPVPPPPIIPGAGSDIPVPPPPPIVPGGGSSEPLPAESSPPTVLAVGDKTVRLVEAALGGPSIHLEGYGIYTPPTTEPTTNPDCLLTNMNGNPTSIPVQCVDAGNDVVYMVLLTAAFPPPPMEWQHTLRCIYGQVFGGGGIARDTVIQTAGGNDNGVFNGTCIAGGLAAAAGSITATVNGVGFKVPRQPTIIKLGLQASVYRLSTPTWGCLVQIDGFETFTYWGCSAGGVFNAFAFGSAIAFQF